MTARRKPKRGAKAFDVDGYAMERVGGGYWTSRYARDEIKRAYRLGKRHGRAERAAKGKRKR